MLKNIRVTLFVLVGLLSSVSLAETLSPAMLEQFKSLPASQQRALAQQYGVNLDSITNQSAATVRPIAEPGPQLQQALPEQTVAEQEPATDTLRVDQAAEVEVTNKQLQPEERSEKQKEVLKRFGRSLFDAQVSTFAPTDNTQVPPNYTIGVGDELIVQLFGKDNNQLNLLVGRDGMVNFPKLGAISVAGLSFEDAQRMLRTRVDEQLIGVTALVSMGQLRAMNIFMAGEVSVPGAYSVSALTTITQALFQSGGITEIGSLRDIQVKRGGQLIASFDLYDLLLQGDMSGDIRLQSGDVVFVPPYKALVTMTGEVKRPAIYEVEDGETLGDLISMAGGYKSSAFAGELVVIKKRNPGELPEALNVSANNDPQLKMPMGNGDIVRVLPLGDNVQRLVTLEGALARPGVYGWREGMRVSDLVSDVRRDLLPDADLSYSLIVREANAELDIRVDSFSLAEAVTAKGSEADPLLAPRDKIIVFSWPGITGLNDEMAGVELESQANSRQRLLAPVIAKLRSQADADYPSQVIEVEGAVKAPGNYPWQSGQTLSDVLSAAGGVDDSADVSSLFVRRLVEVEQGVSEYTMREIKFSEINRFVLQPRDLITIDQRVEWDPNQVRLTGAVKRAGVQPWREGMRISDVVENIQRDLEDTADVSYGVVVREVPLTHNIETLQFSLIDALANPGGASDLLLQARDEILIFDWSGAGRDTPNSRDTLLASVLARLSASASASVGVRIASVSGGVRTSGRYPINDSTTVADLIVAAAGPTDAAFLDSVEIRRNVLDADGQNRLILIEVPNSQFAITPVQSRDNVMVRERVNWNPDEKIKVSGEVLFPGDYYLLPGETLADIVARAGGLTERASVRGAVFTRVQVAAQERMQANRFAQEIEREFAVSFLTQEDVKGDATSVSGITEALRNYTGFGRVVVDLGRALARDTGANLELEDGDALYIPPRSNVVTVVGEVRRSGSITFEKGLSLNDYLSLAAGATPRSDLDNLYVVKASGEVQRGESSWTQFTRATPMIEPGDTIVVPVNTQYKDSIPFWRDITQIIYQGTVTIAAALRF